MAKVNNNFEKRKRITKNEALELLKDKFNIEKKNIYDGIEYVIRNTSLMGRWQILNRTPLTIADTGHNTSGIKEIVMQLSDMKFKKLISATKASFTV